MPILTPLRSGFGSSEQPPDFAHPPLIEVWLGLELALPSDFTLIEAAQWRNRLGPEWLGAWESIGAAERHSPGTTLVERQLRNVMGDRAIRFRAEGFSFGWLGYDGCLYPRYEAIRDGFVATLDAVRDVAPTLGQPFRWTVSYVNRIPQGTVWNTDADWTFFKLWQPGPLQKLKLATKGFAGRWQYPLDAGRSELTIELSHETAASVLRDTVLRDPVQRDTESLWLRITTVGAIESDETSLFDGMDYGRETIVRAFSELVTTDARQFWGAALRK